MIGDKSEEELLIDNPEEAVKSSLDLLDKQEIKSVSCSMVKLVE